MPRRSAHDVRTHSAQRRRLLQTALAGLLTAALPWPAVARPDLGRELGPTIAERGSAHYRFERLHFDSVDGRRRYRVWLGVPRRAAPARGYPVAWLLDGNAAMGELDEPLLDTLSRHAPPLIVALGYDTELRFDVEARAHDYLPAVDASHAEGVPPFLRHDGGGADAFLALIESSITPAVAARAPLDPQRQTLWGHSFGGVFVLHALFTRPRLFSDHVAVSPSLGWKRGAMLTAAERFAARAAATDARLWLLRGEHEGRRIAPPPGTASGHAFDELAARLAAHPDLTLRTRTLAGLEHGATLSASLPYALKLAAGITPQAS